MQSDMRRRSDRASPKYPAQRAAAEPGVIAANDDYVIVHGRLGQR